MTAFERLLAPPRAALIAMALAALAALAGLFTVPVIDRDEARYAQATAQMLESGDPVRIRFQDEPRHKKPVAIYWLQAASVALVSDPAAREIWAWRLPSLLGTMLAALAVHLAGLALAGRRAAFAGASLFAVSVMLATEGAIAKTDAALAAACAFAFLSLVKVRLAASRPDDPGAHPGAWAAAGWAAVAVGAMIKGPVAPLAMGLAVIALSVWERRTGWWRFYLHWPGPLLAAAIVAPWLIAVQIATGGEFLADMLGGDVAPKIASGHEGHGAPPGAHTLLLPVLFFPAIAFLPAGLAAALRGLREGGDGARAARLALAWAVPFFVLFELMPTKLPHYTLPAWPGLAVLAGWGLAELSRTRPLVRTLGAGLALLGALVLAGLVIALARRFEGPQALAAAGGVLLVLCTLAAGFMAVRARRWTALGLAILAALTFHVVARGLVLPASGELFLTRALTRELGGTGLLAGDPQIVSTYTEPSLVFALRGDVELVDVSELAGVLEASRGPLVVILDTARLAEAPDREAAQALRARLEAAACARYAVSGFNYSRGDPTSLLVLRIGGCPQTESPA
ncbi:glycosyltransferase family 39 protein [Marinicauda algicola]|uniref:Glycosyltransferase family 39 protein n=1 Tax=Marinicauda algicola TaxID=2029849 RepID=A0A4S2H4Y4_9PROT|nr:glycosyltransferase family 39 protein [Marinicauda algicola]TGY90498.1 glycosyltransferase family 39 protein [Marinicauda algicola]